MLGFQGEDQPQMVVLGISDRIITSGDIDFERRQSKLFPLTPRILCLGAGDESAHTAVAIQTQRETIESGVTDVASAAQLYAKHFTLRRNQITEQRYLGPLGLNLDTFVSRQRQLNASLAQSLAEQISRYELGVHALVAGVDATGPHIYDVIDPGLEMCHDGSNFVAVGSGARQLEAQLMSVGYDRGWHFPDTLLLLYAAKRRAEVSSGVGPRTDMFVIDKKQFQLIGPEILQLLEECCRDLQEATTKKNAEFAKRLVDWFAGRAHESLPASH
jgi:20S proteasome alpha/beta subunit